MSEQDAKGKAPSELTLRIVSALVLIVVVLAATWAGGTVFLLFCFAVGLLFLLEYLNIARSDITPALHRASMAALVAILAIWIGAGAYPALVALAAAMLVIGGWEIVRARRWWSAGGLAYVCLPLFALVLLRGGEPVGLHAVLVLYGCVWGTDSAAFFAGRAIGGPKLAPVISPKKTWSGFFGGIAGALVAGVAILLLCGYAASAGALLLCAVLSVVSQIGDLGESWLKRRFGIKDSGTLIPGHGGVLDRIDGLVTAAIAAWLIGGYVSGSLLVPAAPAQGLFAAFVLP